MDKKIFVVVFAMFLAVGHGEPDVPSNYDLSRQVNRINGNNGAGYGYPNYGGYPGNYPSGPGLYPGNNYPGNYPGNYPSNYPAGPPGAHPGCPLCDSSVYSYCSHKQAHDSCCCENGAYQLFGCRKSDCKFLYANSCQEYNLISSCCCVDLQKNSIEPVAPVVPVVG
ncbi:hypothetical protein O0L34_g11031 [Tuta absoluta]|nr:hypothetical protein O0L34_g11031 [Tuta absoluta]